jgi:DNA-binding PadR family transcriptional regulator
MARESQTDAVVLAALSVEPMTGYVLRRQVEHNLGHFWSESFGQIYPALARLSADGLIERTHEGGGRADSAPYRLTPTGRSRLVELLSAPPTPATPRNGLLLRLFFGNAIGEEACRRLVADARTQAENQLVYLAQARREAADGSNGENTRYFLITISAGEHAARATILWADETLVALGSAV